MNRDFEILLEGQKEANMANDTDAVISKDIPLHKLMGYRDLTKKPFDIHDQLTKKLKYIYSMPDCPKCEARKKMLMDASVTFVERKGDRLSMDTRIMDKIDKEAHLQLQMQNLTYPVEVDIIMEDD